MSERYTLYHGDCLEILPTLEAGSVDAVIADPPYGTTACKWDSVIPFAPMWDGIKHVVKPRAAVVLFGSQPFTSALVMSNPDWFKYCWVWDKKLAGNFLNANRTPLMSSEDVAVFYDGQCTYNPQMTRGGHRQKGTRSSSSGDGSMAYGAYVGKSHYNAVYYPKNVISLGNTKRDGLHPTQKPTPLMEYLIKTYTNPGDTVLDFTMGSGTTGVAAMRTGRRFIGIELDAEYFRIAEQRIKNAAGEFVRTDKEKQVGQLSLLERGR